MLEVESKFELSRADYEELLCYGEIRRRARQLNIYYDCGWRLADLAATLRIRFASKRHPVLSLKVPVSIDEEKRTMLEIELELAEADSRTVPSFRPTSIRSALLPSRFSEHLQQLGVSDLRRVGWVRNERVELQIDEACTFELDKLELPGGVVVYEAEVENESDEIRERVVRWLIEHAPSARPSTVSKFQRFRNSVDPHP